MFTFITQIIVWNNTFFCILYYTVNVLLLVHCLSCISLIEESSLSCSSLGSNHSTYTQFYTGSVSPQMAGSPGSMAGPRAQGSRTLYLSALTCLFLALSSDTFSLHLGSMVPSRPKDRGKSFWWNLWGKDLWWTLTGPSEVTWSRVNQSRVAMGEWHILIG